jgi:hypothetical protein
MHFSRLLALVSSAVLALSLPVHAETPDAPPVDLAGAPSEPAPAAAPASSPAVATATIAATPPAPVAQTPPAPVVEPPPAPVAAPRSDRPAPVAVWARHAAKAPIALGVNTPFGWYGGSFGASLSIGLGGHHAVRGNIARYEDAMSPLKFVATAAAGGDFASHSGPVSDYGVSWVWYPRQLWSGFLLEAGALLRGRDTLVRLEDENHKTRSTTYAARGMIGWSWVFARHLFVAAAVGLSVGRETGTETFTLDFNIPGSMPKSRMASIDRRQIDGEAYLRIGFALGR